MRRPRPRRPCRFPRRPTSAGSCRCRRRTPRPCSRSGSASSSSASTRTSDFPDAALDVRRDDLQADSADLGPLLALDPDVVIIGDDPTGLAQRLDAEGVASFTGPEPDTLDDVYAQILGIAGVVGRPDLGEDLVASMRASVAAVGRVASGRLRPYLLPRDRPVARDDHARQLPRCGVRRTRPRVDRRGGSARGSPP